MGTVRFGNATDDAQRIIEETAAGTVIHQRQSELVIGRWDFVVFGPSTTEPAKTEIRVCVAEQAMIQQAGLYIASLGDPAQVGHEGMIPLSELAGGELPAELSELSVYHVTPLRPLKTIHRSEGSDLDRTRDQVLEEFGAQNTAIIETPDAAAWAISALRYLHECDEHFPDSFLSTIRGKMRDTSLSFQSRSAH